MKKRSSTVVVLAIALSICRALTPVANSQITAVGPFVGTLQEHFEGFTDFVAAGFLYESSPATVFGGAATLTASNLFVFKPTAGSNFRLWSSGNDATPIDGVKGIGVDNSNAASTFVFTNLIGSFGGYFGARTGANPSNNNQILPDPATITLAFLDSANVQIGATQSWTYSRTGFADGLLIWHGFTTSTLAKKVVVTGTEYAYDNLQATNVPEPGVMASIIGAGTMSGLLLLRRRRKA